MITEEDINSVAYFWGERGDLGRMSGWEEMREDFIKEYPELVKAWDDYMVSRRTLDAIVRDIVARSEDAY